METQLHTRRPGASAFSSGRKHTLFSSNHPTNSEETGAILAAPLVCKLKQTVPELSQTTLISTGVDIVAVPHRSFGCQSIPPSLTTMLCVNSTP
mmetsp:Transcript_35639/g.58179  ORF Transcript_35639/g.58179 Transcript_35639/m.58179 type:complete len:94 (+) Transcript_35639:160-441(+)